MKLYLSSYRLGQHANTLKSMVLGKKRIGVIRNALDFSNDHAKLKNGRDREFFELEALGLNPEEIDLKEYFGAQDKLTRAIDKLDALWIVGGNTFILRRAMHQSGFDEILLKRCRDVSFVYAGYSAGACVVTPTLKGIHLIDDAETIPQGYTKSDIWEGLNIVPFCIAPHYRSDHPESALVEKSIAFFIDNKMPFIALRDGEVYITEVK
jgi:dipeptidase E